MERLRAVRRAHAVDLHHDEAQLGSRHQVLTAAPRLRHERALRTRVDLLDDRIPAARIERMRAHNDAPEVRLAITTLCDEHLRRLEPRRTRTRHVALLE